MTETDEELTPPGGPFIPVPASKDPCTPTDSDVLCGRGGGVNTHPGNETYRHYVERRKRAYVVARFKRDKRLLSECIVKEIRGQNPPGRFLGRDSKDGPWYDIGDIKARDKTSQALRENAPKVRKKMEEESAAKKEEEDQKQRQLEAQRRKAEAAAYGAHPTHPTHAPHGWGYSSYPHPAQQPPPPPSHHPAHPGQPSHPGAPQPQHAAHPDHPSHPGAPQPRYTAHPGQPSHPGAPQPQQHLQQVDQYPQHQNQPHHSQYPYGLPPQNSKTSAPTSLFETVASTFALGNQPHALPADAQPQPHPHPTSAPVHAPIASAQNPSDMVSIDTNDVDKLLENMHMDEDDLEVLAAAMNAEEKGAVAAVRSAAVPSANVPEVPTSSANRGGVGSSAIGSVPAATSSMSQSGMDDKSMSSGLFNIAQTILFSWDNKSTTTNTKNGGGGGGAQGANPQPGNMFSSHRAQEDEVSEEGQEVELLELASMDYDDMPPPPPQPSSRRRLYSGGSSTMRRAKSRMGHDDLEARSPPHSQKQAGDGSWLKDPTQENLPTNVFLGAPQSPGHSLHDAMTMEGVSLCGTEFTAGTRTSIGGASLVGVFDNDTASSNASENNVKGQSQVQLFMAPQTSPLVSSNSNRRRSDYSVGTKNSAYDCDQSMVSAKSYKSDKSYKSESASTSNKSLGHSLHSHGSQYCMSLALSGSAESALLEDASAAGPEQDLLVEGTKVRTQPEEALSS